jgi:hypothetical protein
MMVADHCAFKIRHRLFASFMGGVQTPAANQQAAGTNGNKKSVEIKG